MTFDSNTFRKIKHTSGTPLAECRNCRWREQGPQTCKRARQHSKEFQHTIDVFQETHEEYTCR